jgi:hypothetical protein
LFDGHKKVVSAEVKDRALGKDGKVKVNVTLPSLVRLGS